MNAILFASVLCLSLTLNVSAQVNDKQWQEVTAEATETTGGAEYTGTDVGQYSQAGAGYADGAGGEIGAYGAGYSNDFGQQVQNNDYTDSSGGYLRSNGYAEGDGYGEQYQNGGYGGGDVQGNGYGSGRGNGYGNGQGNAYGNGAGYGEGEGQGAGYGAGDSYGGGEGYANAAGYADLNGNGEYGSAGYGPEDGYGGGLTNEGWERPVKTVVKHVVKNIAVPHPVPAPVHVPVPKYVKYFKPFAIAKPVAIPHVIPVIKHIQKPIPFFASIPVKQTVPVPKFVGLPVQVRVPRPVFIHVPKIVPVAKKVPVPVTVNVPKPYIVPVYKQVPVPVPHKVPKIINIIKEVPHYVKKPVPVYVEDDHSSSYGNAGNTYTSSSYSNHYGNDNFDNYGGGFGNNEGHYSGSQGIMPQTGNSYSNAGFDFGKSTSADIGQHGGQYSESQSTYGYNSGGFLFNNQKLQGFQNIPDFQSQKLQYPQLSRPRAHRLPNKVASTNNAIANSQQQQGSYNNNQNYQNYHTNSYRNIPAPALEINVEVKPSAATAGSANYNSANQQATYVGQGQASSPSELYYQNGKMNNNYPSSDDYSNAAQNNVEAGSTKYSQPVYNPNAYAEYAANQGEYNHNYSQPFSSDAAADNTAASSQTMMSQATKPQYFNQHPSNAYSLGYNSNHQSGGMNNIPQVQNFENYNLQQVQNVQNPSFSSNSNFGFGNSYAGNGYDNMANNMANNIGNQMNNYKINPFQSNQLSSQGHQSTWSDNKFNQNLNNFASQQQMYNQNPSYTQSLPPSNVGYNQNMNNYGLNVLQNNNGYQQNKFRNNNQAQFNNYVPAGISSSSSSVSSSGSSQNSDYQPQDYSHIYKQNEKFDHGAIQSSYLADSNVPPQGRFVDSGLSVSYSNSGYENSYDMNPQQSASQIVSNSQAVPFNNPRTQVNNMKNMPQPLANTNSLANQIPPSYTNFVSADSANSYSAQAQLSSTYTSNGYSNKNDYSQTSSKTVPQNQASNFQPLAVNNIQNVINSNQSQQPQTFNSNTPGLPKPTYSTSYTYTYVDQASTPEKSESKTKPDMPFTLNSKDPKPQTENATEKNTLSFKGTQKPSTTPMQFSQPLPNSDVTNSKLDEMERHIQSSASSIINVYTNSPESMGGKMGNMLPFLDSTAMGSSQVATFFQPQDADSEPNDMKIGPQYQQDPAEPLQTSLDAYVPMQPIYQAEQHNPKLVYKQAVSQDGEYKEAVSLNQNLVPKNRS